MLQSHFLFSYIKSQVTCRTSLTMLVHHRKHSCYNKELRLLVSHYKNFSMVLALLVWVTVFFLICFFSLCCFCWEKKECRNLKHKLNLFLDDQTMRKVMLRDGVKKISCWARTKRRIFWSSRQKGRTQEWQPHLFITSPEQVSRYRWII